MNQPLGVQMKEALEKVKDKVILFAESEGLTAHANSVRKRFK